MDEDDTLMHLQRMSQLADRLARPPRTHDLEWCRVEARRIIAQLERLFVDSQKSSTEKQG